MGGSPVMSEQLEKAEMSETWMRSVLLGTGVPPTSEDTSQWLFADPQLSTVHIADESQAFAINASLEAGALTGSLLDRVMKPMLVSRTDFVHGLGEGWVFDTPSGMRPAPHHLRAVRYVLQSDASGAVGAHFSVAQPDGTFVVATVVATNGGRILMWRLQQISRSGQPMGKSELHSLYRFCKGCGKDGMFCRCAKASTWKRSGPNDAVARLQGTWRVYVGDSTYTASVVITREVERIRQLEDLVFQRLLSLDSEEESSGTYLMPEPRAVPGSFVPNDGSVTPLLMEAEAARPELVPYAGSLTPLITKSESAQPALPGTGSGYPCDVCGRVFSQSGHRNEHRRRVHFGEGHRCPLCDKPFGVPSKLRRHLRTVHRNHLHLSAALEEHEHTREHTHVQC